MNIKTFLSNRPDTLSSVSLVKLVNRLPLRRAPYTHAEVAAKIREVLGEVVEKYAATQTYHDVVCKRRTRRVYNLPHAQAVAVLLSMPSPIYSMVISTKRAITAETVECVAQLVLQTPIQAAVTQLTKPTTPQGEPMKLDKLFINDDQTVCSTTLAVWANNLRAGRSPYTHGAILAKVRKVFGLQAEKFASSGMYANGYGGYSERRIYNFPKKEALKMMTSFSSQITSQIMAAKAAYDLPAHYLQPQGEITMKLSTLSLTQTGEVLTMSSLEMVKYINDTRKLGEAELMHKNFLAKVPTVLGKDAAKFSAASFYQGNGSAQLSRNIYNFPKREAMLMAMSYSYELQAQVFDAWETAEAALVKPAQNVFTLPDFTNPGIAARAWAEQFEAKLVLTNEIKEAQPKIAFHDAVVGDGSTFALAEVAKVLGLGPNKFNQMLRDGGYLMGNNVAYQHYIVLGVFMLQYSGYVLEDGKLARPTTRVTSKGITYLQKKFGKVAVTA